MQQRKHQQSSIDRLKPKKCKHPCQLQCNGLFSEHKALLLHQMPWYGPKVSQQQACREESSKLYVHLHDLRTPKTQVIRSAKFGKFSLVTLIETLKSKPISRKHLITKASHHRVKKSGMNIITYFNIQNKKIH